MSLSFIHFARISGYLLLPAFGGIALVFHLHGILVSNLEARIQRHGQPVFATLNRAQEVPTVLGGRYYYSYSGHWEQKQFRRLEEVPRELFHVMSEGKNVQAMVYRDGAGGAHIRLRDNALPYGRRLRLLKYSSLFLAALGAMFMAFSYLARPFVNRNES